VPPPSLASAAEQAPTPTRALPPPVRVEIVDEANEGDRRRPPLAAIRIAVAVGAAALLLAGVISFLALAHRNQGGGRDGKMPRVTDYGQLVVKLDRAELELEQTGDRKGTVLVEVKPEKEATTFPIQFVVLRVNGEARPFSYKGQDQYELSALA